MRNLLDPEVDGYRRRDREVVAHFGSIGDSGNGVFEVPSRIDRAGMRVLASNGEGWDHVSVSRRTRCPNWEEMEQIARLFFRPDETAMQLHVPASDHISVHHYCLHWWRPQAEAIPRPPGTMVA